jgi:hypothetical protein
MDLVYSNVMYILYITLLYAFLILAVYSPAAQLSLPAEGLLITHPLMMSVISNMAFLYTSLLKARPSRYHQSTKASIRMPVTEDQQGSTKALRLRITD